MTPFQERCLPAFQAFFSWCTQYTQSGLGSFVHVLDLSVGYNLI